MTSPVMHPRNSAIVKAIGYDPETQELHVQGHHHGAPAKVYTGVPPDKGAAALSIIDGPAHYLLVNIIGVYPRRQP